MMATIKDESTPPDKKRSQGNIALHSHIHGRSQRRSQFLNGLFLRTRPAVIEIRVPIPLNFEMPFSIDRVVSRWQFADVLENRSRMRDILVGDVLVQSGSVNLTRQAGYLQQAFQLAGEEQAIALVAVHQRLLSQAVATEYQLPIP